MAKPQKGSHAVSDEVYRAETHLLLGPAGASHRAFIKQTEKAITAAVRAVKATLLRVHPHHFFPNKDIADRVTVFDTCGGAKPRHLWRGQKHRLSINPEQTLGSNSACVERVEFLTNGDLLGRYCTIPLPHKIINLFSFALQMRYAGIGYGEIILI